MQRTNKLGRDLIRRFEGEHLYPYLDPAGNWTIGVGHLLGPDGPDGPDGLGALDAYLMEHGIDATPLTPEEATALFHDDLQKVEVQVLEATQGVELTQNQFAALVSFTFNLGEKRLKSLLVQGKPDPSKFRKYRYAGGKSLPGLAVRRGAEEQLWLTPDPPKPQPIDRRSRDTIRVQEAGRTWRPSGWVPAEEDFVGD